MGKYIKDQVINLWVFRVSRKKYLALETRHWLDPFLGIWPLVIDTDSTRKLNFAGTLREHGGACHASVQAVLTSPGWWGRPGWGSESSCGKTVGQSFAWEPPGWELKQEVNYKFTKCILVNAGGVQKLAFRITVEWSSLFITIVVTLESNVFVYMR